MSSTSRHRAILFSEHANAAEVLHVDTTPTLRPRPGQVRVRMLLSPLNPSDLLFVQGVYGKPPMLPATPGFEGVGIVEESGGGPFGWFLLGKRVAVPNPNPGNWQEQVIVPATRAIPIPRSIPDDQAACFVVNPATAYIMITKVLRVRKGEWLLQTAAGSALGKMVIKLGKHYGFRTINLVRRQETADHLLALGADVVINTTSDDVVERVQELTNKQGVRYAVDAVGGDIGSRAVGCLAPGGYMLVYGSLSFEPIHLDPRFMIFGSRRVEGFWLTDWVRDRNPLVMFRLFRQVGRLLQQQVLTSEIAAIYDMDQISQAVRFAQEPGRQGKILLRLTKTP